jgi:Domain of unknown function (DUF4412)
MRIGMPVVMMGCSLAAALAVAAPGGAQTSGAVTWSIQGVGGANGPRTMIQYFKGSQMRIDMPQAGMMGGIIMNASTGDMTMLMPAQRAYMQYNIAQMGANMAPQATGQITVTAGGSETVAGISCTDYTISGGPGGPTQVCAASGVPSMDPKALTTGPMAQFVSRMGMNAQVVAAYQQLKGKGPLKVSKVESGNTSLVMVATNVSTTTPPDSLFQIPTGWTKFQMPAGAGGMPGMAGPPKAP